jgi:hypothetical protein
MPEIALPGYDFSHLAAWAQKCMKQAFQGMILAIWLHGLRNA